jgi:hypothetical protein
VNGTVLGVHGFNATLVDGAVGLMTEGGTTSIDHLRLRTDATAFAAEAMKAVVTAPDGAVTAPVLDLSEAIRLLDAAVILWRDSGLADAADLDRLGSVSLLIADLPGSTLALELDGVITVDIDAAGHGWFVDPTPFEDEEYVRDATGRLLAVEGGPSDGRVDLLTVLLHELGHVLAYAHGDLPVMTATLDVGERITLFVPEPPAFPESEIILPEGFAPTVPDLPAPELYFYHQGLDVFVTEAEAGSLTQEDAPPPSDLPDFVLVDPVDGAAPYETVGDDPLVIEWTPPAAKPANGNGLAHGRNW